MEINPDNLLKDGYPTKKWLKFLKNYDPEKSKITLKDFIFNYLPNGLKYENIAYEIKEKKNTIEIELHTLGWSGNEEVMDAMLKNFNLLLYLKFEEMKRGGHYKFSVERKLL